MQHGRSLQNWVASMHNNVGKVDAPSMQFEPPLQW
jgi:hypothetical protein